MDDGMKPGRKYRLRLLGDKGFVDGFFENNLFYEGVPPYLRVGFIDAKSCFFYRHGNALAEPHFRIDLVEKISGLTLTGIGGNRYQLVEADTPTETCADPWSEVKSEPQGTAPPLSQM